MKRFLSATVIILTFALLAFAQAPSGLKVEDLFRFKRVGDPQVSPDGRTTAYVITSYDRDANKSSNQIWLVPTEGGGAQLIPGSSNSDERPRWSPNGKQLAFISSRDGASQIWLLDVGSSEPHKLTNLSTEAADLVWAPDSTHLLFTSDIYPECPDDDCNRQRLDKAAASKVKAKVSDRLLFRHWKTWKEGKRSHVFVVATTGGPARDLTPGDFDAPPFSLGGQDNYTFSPDSREVCFARNTDKVEAISTNNDLFIVPTTGGEAKRITTNKGSDTNPLYSPDGRYIAYRSQERAGFESDRFRLMLYDRQSGQSKGISDSLDRAVDNFIWAPDSQKLYFTAEDAGYSLIYQVDVAGTSVKKLTEKSASGDLDITRDGGTLVFTRSSLTQPSEVYTLKLNNLAVKQLTNSNQELLAQRKLVDGEDFYSTGAGGAKVHSILLKPTNFEPGKKYPMVVLIHGGPQGAWMYSFSYRWNPNIYTAAGYVVLMPNPRGSTGYGQKFVDEISGDWGGKAYEDIMGAVDRAATLDFVDKDHMGAAGASYGGYMIDWIMGHTDRFKALVSHAGVFNLASMYGVTEELWFSEWEFKGTPWTNPEEYSKFSPINFVKNFKTPTLVTHGEIDYRVPVGEGLQLFTALQRMNVPSKLVIFPDEGHWILKPQNSELWYNTVLDWFKTYLK